MSFGKKKIPGTILARMQGLGFAILACFCKLHDLPLTVESGVVVALGKDGNMVIRDGVHIQHALEKHLKKKQQPHLQHLFDLPKNDQGCSDGAAYGWGKKGKHPRNSRNEIHPPSGDAKTSQEAEERHAQDPHVSKLRFHIHLLVGYWWQSTTAHKWTKDQEHVLYFCTIEGQDQHQRGFVIVEILSNLGRLFYLVIPSWEQATGEIWPALEYCLSHSTNTVPSTPMGIEMFLPLSTFYMQNLQVSPPFPHGGFTMWEKWCHLQTSLLSSNHKGRHARIHLTLVAVSSKLSLMVGVSGGSWTPTFFRNYHSHSNDMHPRGEKKKRWSVWKLKLESPKKCGTVILHQHTFTQVLSTSNSFRDPIGVSSSLTDNAPFLAERRILGLKNRRSQMLSASTLAPTTLEKRGKIIAKQMRTPAVSPKWWQLK